jgi:hypothetical protein
MTRRGSHKSGRIDIRSTNDGWRAYVFVKPNSDSVSFEAGDMVAAIEHETGLPEVLAHAAWDLAFEMGARVAEGHEFMRRFESEVSKIYEDWDNPEGT